MKVVKGLSSAVLLTLLLGSASAVYAEETPEYLLGELVVTATLQKFCWRRSNVVCGRLSRKQSRHCKSCFCRWRGNWRNEENKFSLDCMNGI